MKTAYLSATFFVSVLCPPPQWVLQWALVKRGVKGGKIIAFSLCIPIKSSTFAEVYPKYNHVFRWHRVRYRNSSKSRRSSRCRTSPSNSCCRHSWWNCLSVSCLTASIWRCTTILHWKRCNLEKHLMTMPLIPCTMAATTWAWTMAKVPQKAWMEENWRSGALPLMRC